MDKVDERVTRSAALGGRNPIAMFAVRDAIQIASCSPDEGGSGDREKRIARCSTVYRCYCFSTLSQPSHPRPDEIRFVMEMQCSMPL